MPKNHLSSHLFVIIAPVVLLLLGLLYQPEASIVNPTKQTTQSQQNPTPTGAPANNQPTASTPPSPSNTAVNTDATTQLAAASAGHTAGDRREGATIVGKDGSVYPLRTYRTLLVPNDPYANQWWESPNAMQTVWDMPYGSRATKIAVIDTGFGLSHQEFSGRWATNSGEAGGLANNGIDDDGNGFVDDWRGWDFTANDNTVQAGQTNPNGEGTTHGTMVASVLGATGNNGVGIAGVNWYSSILPIQALNDNGYGDSYTVASAVYYAADQGADIINISLGTNADDPYLRQAMKYALEKGSIVVAAAGNDGCDCMVYPANYPEVIAVGALNSSLQPSSFSSYGSRLDIMAPGQSMTTAYWTNSNQTASYASNAAGTSFAAPFVSGLLGLARSHQPNATWEELVGAMIEKADRRTLTAATPRTNQIGFGYVRANTMLDRVRSPQNSIIRYNFGPSIDSVERAHQCQTDIPATMLYELSKQGQLRFTASPFENYQAGLQGWSSRELFYTCIGLPTDTFDLLRTLSLTSEIYNRTPKQ